MLLWNQDGPSQNGLGAALWGSVLVSGGLWHPPAQVQTLPGVPLPVSSAKQLDRILAVPTALDTGPPWAVLSWHGGMGALGLPESCRCLCQDRRSKITQSCFYASGAWAHSSPF